jgi:hypothetical protein
VADIELVIKIPEEEYKNICLMSKDGIGMALYDWIANGTPLPEEYGKLIDADAYRKELLKEIPNLDYDCSLELYEEGIYSAIMSLGDAPTIIKANKE